MSNARQYRGTGNDIAKWINAPIWDNLKKPEVKEGCQHNSIKWAAEGKVCKECGDKL